MLQLRCGRFFHIRLIDMLGRHATTLGISYSIEHPVPHKARLGGAARWASGHNVALPQYDKMRRTLKRIDTEEHLGLVRQ